MSAGTETITLTDQQMKLITPNVENHLAWCIASGLAGWMQMCCAKIVGYHVCEDPARMILVEILQAQRESKWLNINQSPTSWSGVAAGTRMDVCLGDGKADPSRFWAMELKWPFTAPDSKRTQIRVEIIQDLARLVTVTTSEPPHARYLIFGCMEQVADQLFGKAHEKEELETQRKLFRNMLSPNLAEPIRNTLRKDIASTFPDFENRVPKAVRLGDKGTLCTRLLSAQEILMGIARIGHVFVWQCDHVAATVAAVPQAEDAATKASNPTSAGDVNA